MKTMHRRYLALVMGLYAFSASAQEASNVLQKRTVRPIELHISPQPLVDALNEFARQSGLQLLLDADEAAQRTSAPPLSGSYTPEDALKVLLANVSLRYEFLDSRTVAIRSAKSREPIAGLGIPNVRSERMHDIRLVQSESTGSAPTTAQAENSAAPADESEPDQNAKKQQAEIETIIVTAQRREQQLQNVPISISVLSGDDLDQSTSLGLTDELRLVPGVAISEFGRFAGEGSISIRGVSAQIPQDSGSSPTAYYVDGVPFGYVRSAYVPSPPTYDLDRVEVLRGAQGTLYGASSLNGVVRVLTKDANPDEFELKMSGLTSNTKDGDLNYGGDLAVNVPIVKGKLAARAVAGYRDFNGWIDKPQEENANDSEVGNLRLKVGAQPTDDLSIDLSAWLSRSDDNGPPLADDDGNNPIPFDEPISSDMDVYSLKIGYAFPWLSLTSTTSYIDFRNSTFLSLSPSTGFLFDRDNEVFAQEVLLTSEREGAWLWSVGAMYRDADEHADASLPGIFTQHSDSVYNSKSFALFGELTRLFLDGRVELTAGLRGFEDDQTSTVFSNLTEGVLAQPVATDAKYDSTTPRMILTWHASEKLTTYASYAEGFRSGFEQVPDIRDLFPTVRPDSLINYEVGAKGTLAGGRVRFETAAYYMDWQDVQSTVFVPLEVPGSSTTVNYSTNVNGDSASGPGVDFAVTARPVDPLELGITFSWNDLTVDKDVLSGGFVFINEGERLDYSAEYTAGVTGNYFFPVGRSGLEGQLSASANYTSAVVARSLNLTTGITTASESDVILTSRASFSLRTPDHWRAIIFVDNLNNEQGASSYKHATLPWQQVRLRPRTVGVQFEYRY